MAPAGRCCVIEALRDMLAAIDPPPFRHIGLAAEYASLDAPPPPARLPAAYVIETTDTAEANGLLTGGVRQRLTRGFAVVILVSTLRDDKGGQAAISLAPLRQAVRIALLGGAPSDAYEPITYSRGRLLAAERGILAWQDEYQARTMLRSA